MRSIDEDWESGDVIYLDDIEKCTKTHVVKVNGEKNYLYVNPIKKGLLEEVIKIFPNGKITLHYTDLDFNITCSVKNGKYIKGTPTIGDSKLSTIIYWFDENGKRITIDGINQFDFHKHNESIEISFALKHRTKELKMIVSKNDKPYFRGRGRYLKRFMCCDIKDYAYYADLIHSIVP